MKEGVPEGYLRCSAAEPGLYLSSSFLSTLSYVPVNQDLKSVSRVLCRLFRLLSWYYPKLRCSAAIVRSL